MALPRAVGEESSFFIGIYGIVSVYILFDWFENAVNKQVHCNLMDCFQYHTANRGIFKIPRQIVIYLCIFHSLINSYLDEQQETVGI